jgi:phage terminase Nu1 subunit (DNA packaging protein)
MSSICDLSRVTGIPEKTLYNLRKRGIVPESTDIEVLVRSMIVYYKDLLNKKEQRSGDPLVEQKIRLTEAQANKFEIENQLKTGDLVEAKGIEDVWTRAVLATKSRLLLIPSKLSFQLGKEDNPLLIQQILEAEIFESLQELSRVSIPREDFK